MKSVPKKRRYGWWAAAAYGACGGAALLPPIALLDDRDRADALAILFVIPIFAGLIVVAARRQRQRTVSIVAAVAAFVCVAYFAERNAYDLHVHAKWLRHRNSYIAELSVQRRPNDYQLRHEDWDDWGAFGIDTSTFVVFDPADSLADAAIEGKAGKVRGIPCPVYRVTRLEPRYYDVWFFAGTSWNACKAGTNARTTNRNRS